MAKNVLRSGERLLAWLQRENKMKEGDTVVELDQFKYTLSTFQKPLVEVRDSL